MQEKEVLDSFTRTGALLSGHFELRSGLHSDQYFQCALLLQYPRLAGALCNTMLPDVRKALEKAPLDGVIAPALGGIPVGQEFGRLLDVKAIFAEKDSQGRLVLRRGFEIHAGKHYLVAEDVVTRGGRVQETIDIVTARGGRVAAVAVLVDRSAGQAHFDAPFVSLVRMTPSTWEPEDCPLCRKGIPLDHPGS